MTKVVKRTVSTADEVTPGPCKTPSLRVLIAEGNLRVRRILSLLLTGAENTVTAVRDGAELSKALEATVSAEGGPQWNLIIMNDALPGTDGLVVLEHLCLTSHPPPFILMTTNPRVQAVARQLGAAVLENPLSRQQLACALKDAQAACSRRRRGQVSSGKATLPPQKRRNSSLRALRDAIGHN